MKWSDIKYKDIMSWKFFRKVKYKFICNCIEKMFLSDKK